MPPLFAGWHASCCIGVVSEKKSLRTFQNQPLKGIIMNIHKHMEAIFVVTLAAIGVGAFALDSVPEAEAKAVTAQARDVATPGTMAVVIVRAPKAQRHA
jgi:hypothetical protein